MSFIILTRNPKTRRLLIITDESGSDAPKEFETEDAAIDTAITIKACAAWGFKIAEVHGP